MSDEQKGLDEILSDLEAVETVNESAWQKALGVIRDALNKSPVVVEVATPEPEPVVELSENTDDFSEQIKMLEEQFNERLAEEQKAREQAEEKFAEERQLRLVREYAAQIATDYSSLPMDNHNQMAADMLAIQGFSAEVHDRLQVTLKAANEAVDKGSLFEQFSNTQPATSDPFEGLVEKIRQEQFGEMDKVQGWAAAFDVAAATNRELATAYANKH